MFDHELKEMVRESEERILQAIHKSEERVIAAIKSSANVPIKGMLTLGTPVPQ